MRLRRIITSRCYDVDMRTTINLPEDVYRAARSLSEIKGISLGEALAELVRRGLNPATFAIQEKAFPCFAPTKDSRRITLEETLDAEDQS